MKTASFERIGDFYPWQMFYDVTKKSWILVDWTDHHREAIVKSLTELETKTITSFTESLFLSFKVPPLGQASTQTGHRKWKSKAPPNAWLADLANQLDEDVTRERVRLFQSPMLKVNVDGDLATFHPPKASGVNRCLVGILGR